MRALACKVLINGEIDNARIVSKELMRAAEEGRRSIPLERSSRVQFSEKRAAA
jgi:hypothetical protein